MQIPTSAANKMQLTTDGHKPYLEAVEAAFGGEIDYAMLIKLYEGERAGEARYSPAVCNGCKKEVIPGRGVELLGGVHAVLRRDGGG
jgi:hypothetical protein